MATYEYKDAVNATIEKLDDIASVLQERIVNLVMAGDLKEWNDGIKPGESFRFDGELFENSDDVNVKLLFDLIEKVHETKETIKNINALK